MAKLQEIADYTPEIDAISRADAVEGGLSGVSNQPLKQLANRTKWLKQKVDEALPAASFNPAAFATAAQGTKADAALPASSFNPAAFATAAQGAKADEALPASSFNPAAFATAAQGTKADEALPASSFNPAAFATAAQGTKADAALPASNFNPAAFATAAQGIKADEALPASSAASFAPASIVQVAEGGGKAQSGVNTFHDNKIIKTRILTKVVVAVFENDTWVWEAKVEHGLGDVMNLQRIVSIDAQVKMETYCEMALSHTSAVNGLSLRYDDTYVSLRKMDNSILGKNAMFAIRYVDS